VHSSNVIFVPGPMHPDLFDGETPIMIPAKRPDVYEITVGYVVTRKRIRDSVQVCVAAYNKKDAEKAALEEAEDQAGSDVDDFEIEEVEKLDRDPKPHELEELTARQRVAEGRD
jgi:hypothetical protein